MKKLFVVTTALFSLSSIAGTCPVLEGTYTQCTTGGRFGDQMAHVSEKIIIEQQGETYKIIEDTGTPAEVIVGKEVLASDTVEELSVKYGVTGSCSDNKLVLNIDVKEMSYTDGREIGEEETMSMEIFKDVMTSSAASFSLKGDTLVIENGFVPVKCTKN